MGLTVQNLINYLKAVEDLTDNKNKVVNKKEYEIFCKEFVFYKLKGKSFGKAFCERFDFNDIFLKGLSDDVAKDHIEKLGYIK